MVRCERLAMVWMVKTSDGAEGEARNWREVGGVLFSGAAAAEVYTRSLRDALPTVMVRRGEV